MRVEIALASGDSIGLEDDAPYNPSIATELLNKAAALATHLMQERAAHPLTLAEFEADEEGS